MYTPKHFDEPDSAVLHQLMQAYPLATLVALSSTGLNANHIPLYLALDGAGHGVLRGHVARANPIWKDFSPDTDALAIFQGPQAYITPSWYPSKAENGKVVPTWNYAVAHAYGRMRVIDDTAWLQAQIEALTAQNEARVGSAWQVSDAPEDYTGKMLKAIVGIEIPITRLLGKWKVSQNQSEANRQGVQGGLRQSGEAHAHAMASLVAGKAQSN